MARKLSDSTSKPTAVVAQVGGTHYARPGAVCPACYQPIQHWDLYAREPYLEAQVARYTLRWREKGGLEDLNKARSFLDKLIALAKIEVS